MSSWKHVSTRRKVAKFSSRSLGSYAGSERTIHRPGNSYFGFGNQDALGLSVNALVMNSSLLEPLQLDLDPNIRTIKVQEKEQIKTLNDRFACFINKLEEKADFNNRKRYKNSDGYEEEINKRYKAEDDFVSVKKDVDAGYFDRINLEEEWSEIRLELDFFKALYAEEVRELKEQLKDTSVVVEMDNSRQLNMEQVVKHLKSQNEEVSARSRQEAEAWYQKKVRIPCYLKSQRK
ncbi:keratin, type II cytoskeletal 8 isoform X1 [Tachysurus ichikawai]